MLRKQLYCGILCYSALLGKVKAQEITESPGLLSKNDLKIGYNTLYSQHKTDESKLETFIPSILTLRYAVSDRLEVLGLFSYAIEKETIEDKVVKRSGLQPATLLLKTPILKQKGVIPKMSLLGGATFSNIALKDYKNEDLQWNLLAAFSNELNDKLLLSYNLGFTYEKGSHSDFLYTTALDYIYTNQSRVYAEVIGNVPREGKHDIHCLLGWQHVFKDKFEWDITTGTALEGGLKWYISTGLTWLIHTKKEKATR